MSRDWTLTRFGPKTALCVMAAEPEYGPALRSRIRPLITGVGPVEAAAGVAEDPVTGSAHCALGPFWAERLGRTQLRARQISARGGELVLELQGDRVWMSGQALTLWQGEWLLPPAP